jgi:hypothetical protein
MALLELAGEFSSAGRPERWPALRKRNVETRSGYRASLEALSRKKIQAGPTGCGARYRGLPKAKLQD